MTVHHIALSSFGSARDTTQVVGQPFIDAKLRTGAQTLGHCPVPQTAPAKAAVSAPTRRGNDQVAQRGGHLSHCAAFGQCQSYPPCVLDIVGRLGGMQTRNSIDGLADEVSS